MTLTNRQAQELEDLLHAMCEEELTEAQARRLEQIVESDDDACRYYLIYVHLHGILYWNTARPMPVFGASREERGTTHAIRGVSDVDPPIAAIPVTYPPVHTFFSGALCSYAIATLILAIGVLGAWAWLGQSERGVAPLEGNLAMPTTNVSSEAVAQIIGVKDCRWADTASAVTVGQTVTVGQKFALTAGRLEIAYNIGDRVAIEGPATFEVDSSHSGRLLSGKVTFRSMLAELLGAVSDLPAKGYPKPPIFIKPMFALRGPGVIVIDAGGDYTLVIDESGISHATLAKGKIELRYPHGVKPGDSCGGRYWCYAEGDKKHYFRAVCETGEMPPHVQAEMANARRNNGRTLVWSSDSWSPMRGKAGVGVDSTKPGAGLP